MPLMNKATYFAAGALAIALLSPAPRLAAQVAPEQAADMLLTAARKSFNDKNHAFAAGKFREFLAKFAQHKEANSARYGLALCLIDGADKNFTEARDLLQNLANHKDDPERPYVSYYLALACRGLGLHELSLAETNPTEAAARRSNALKNFDQAATHFEAALVRFSEMMKQTPAVKEQAPAREWAARALCDRAEMLLRTSKAKEVLTATAPFVGDGPLATSKCREQARYYRGFAAFLLKDYAEAQKSLTLVAPFSHPEYGPHARYLLARTHHLADEKAEAAVHYEGTLADYAKNKAAATELLKQPQKLPNDPAERQRLETLVKEPPPDHVARTGFYLGMLLYEGGRFAEAKAKFAEFPKVHPLSALRVEAELRVGLCQVQLREFNDALKTLTPLIDREARLSDQVLYWLGKAQLGAAPDTVANAPGFAQAANVALATLRQAAERAQRLQDQDPEAKSRRGQCLLEIADLQQALKQHREAAGVYQHVLNDKLLSEREPEVLHRLASALHLAGDFAEADKACARFLEKFTRSPLVPAVLFIHAENSYFRGLAAEKNPNANERAKELERIHDETVKRFILVVEKFPEFPRINLARYSLGLTYYRHSELDKAYAALAAVPVPERSGDLALVPYIMADCVLRQAPAKLADDADALVAGKLAAQLKTAAELLETFLAAVQNGPQTADALIKYGLCQQRLAALLAQPPEKAKALAAARAAYEKVLGKEFAGNPLVPQAVLERAKVIALSGNANDVTAAISELQRFTADLKNSPIAPMALIQLAVLHRQQNKAADAAALLQKAREQYEGVLSGDPARSSWIHLLRYHHGMALREAGKLPEARQVFDLVVKQAANRPEGAEAALRFGQCLKDEAQARFDAAKKLQGNPKEAASVQKLAQEGQQLLRVAAGFLEGQAEQLKKSDNMGPFRARMLYEAAWANRLLTEPEVLSAKNQVTLETKKARGLYQALIDGYPEMPLASEARFELAELLAQGNEYDVAVKLLTDALDKEPTPELTDKCRLRLGAIHAAKGNLKAALSQFDAVAANPKSPLAGWAHYRAGEAQIQNQLYSEAVKRLGVFRDQPAFQNVPGLSDRALLSLGQAYGYLKDWDASRGAHQRMAATFPDSPWIDEARYGVAWAYQNQANFDAAVAQYGMVTARTVAEIAAKAQFQIGLCRLEQRRYIDAANALLVVPYTYDYPELSAAALLEAGRAYADAGQKDQAVRVWRRLVRDYPETPFAEAAKEKLGEKKEK